MSIRSNRLLVHYGEIALKGKNRRDFERRLQRNIRQRLAQMGAEWPVRRAYDHLFIELPPGADRQLEDALAALEEVSGVAWFAPALLVPAAETGQASGRLERAVVEERMVALARARHVPGGRFAVRANRGDKRIPVRSSELERWLGAAIQAHTPWHTVDLERPDVTFRVDVQPEGFYFYADRRPGPGGLPVGSGGRVLALLSGGLDSPVAGYLASKRGCSVDFIHFAASLMQQRQAVDYKISRIVEHLSRRTLSSTLYLVPYTHFELGLQGRTEYELVIFRRFMAATAEVLAGRLRAQALVTGDNLGQVASQTLENIAAFTRAVEIPVLRPLITYDKQEIVQTARRIGTYDFSIIPYKDCCAIISRHPKTRSRHEVLQDIERELLPDYAALVEKTLTDAVVLSYECGARAHRREAAAGSG